MSNKKSIAVFTAWPDLISDLHKVADFSFQESMQQVLVKNFYDEHVDHGLERFSTRVHDMNLYPEFEFCLYVKHPVNFDISDILDLLESDVTTYLDSDQNFAFYQRRPVWFSKLINSQCFAEDRPQAPGVILIDCWQEVQDQGRWLDRAPGWNFFENMVQILPLYRPKNFLFHTGDYGNPVLAQALEFLHRQGNAVDIMDLQIFQRHYQAQNIFDWIVVGAHWGICTHDKPLGFYNLLDLKKTDPRLRIYSHMDCTLKRVNNDMDHPIKTTCTPSDYKNDSLQWRLNHKIPELIGPIAR